MRLGTISTLAFAAILGFAAIARADVPPPPVDTKANKALVEEAFQRLFVERRVFDEADNYLAADFIEHNPTAGNGVTALKAFFKDLVKQNPNFSIEAKRVIAENDLVFVHFHMRNDAKDPKDRGVAGVDIFRIEHGKIAEHWDVLQTVPEKSANNNTMF